MLVVMMENGGGISSSGDGLLSWSESTLIRRCYSRKCVLV